VNHGLRIEPFGFQAKSTTLPFQHVQKSLLLVLAIELK
jgi:hypothetical protein